MPWTCLDTDALTSLLVEDMVERAGGRRDIANTLAGIAVEILVRATVLNMIPVTTHTLTGLHIEFFIWATHICCKYVCREGRRERDTQV